MTLKIFPNLFHVKPLIFKTFSRSYSLSYFHEIFSIKRRNNFLKILHFTFIKRRLDTKNIPDIYIHGQKYFHIEIFPYIFLDFTELFPLQKNTIVNWGHMLLFYSRVYVFRSSVLNIDWNIFLLYYLNHFIWWITESDYWFSVILWNVCHLLCTM
jgi:hypothetical protein